MKVQEANELARLTIKWADHRIQAGEYSRPFVLSEWCNRFGQSQYTWRKHITPALIRMGVAVCSDNRNGTRLGPKEALAHPASIRSQRMAAYARNTAAIVEMVEDTFPAALSYVEDGNLLVKQLRANGERVRRTTEALLLTVGGDVSLNPAALVDGLR